MSQPLFIFVLYTDLYTVLFIDDSFKEYTNPVILINLKYML